MRKTNLILTCTAVLTISMAALTACSTAEASTHAAAPENTTAAGVKDHSSNRLEDILNRGYLEVATEPSFAPNEFIDPTKSGEEQYVGSDIELAKFIANDLGVELRLKPMDFTSVLGSISSGKFDLAISALAYTPERAQTMNLSKGYYYGSEDPQKAYGILIRREDADQIRGIEDLAGKSVVAQNGSIQEQFVQEQIPAYGKYMRVSSTNDAFLTVQSGRADAAAAALKMAQLYLDSNPQSGMMILEGFYFSVDEATQGTRIGIPKGEDELTKRIDEIIDDVVEQDLYNQWYDEYKEYAKTLGIQ